MSSPSGTPERYQVSDQAQELARLRKVQKTQSRRVDHVPAAGAHPDLTWLRPGEVLPKRCVGFAMSLLGALQGLGPKFTIGCGRCSKVWRERPTLVNYPAVRCPHCGAINRLPLTNV